MNPIVIERVGKIEDYKVHWYSADADNIPVNDPKLTTKGRGGDSKPLTDAQKQKLKKFDENIAYYKNKGQDYFKSANLTSRDLTPSRSESSDDFRKRRDAEILRLRNLGYEQFELMIKEEIKKFEYQKEIGTIAPTVAYEGQTVEQFREARNTPAVLLSSTLNRSNEEKNNSPENMQSSKKIIKIAIGALVVGLVIYIGYKIVK